MGQIFTAIAYDVDEKECVTVYADKFDANCYSYSYAVLAMHYLLRQKPYRVLWLGDYVTTEGCISDICDDNTLIGVSVRFESEDFEGDVEAQQHQDKLKILDKNHSLWKRIDLPEDTVTNYFNYDQTSSARYSGYLVDYDEHRAINLSDYWNRSSQVIPSNYDREVAVDILPIVTDVGGGGAMIFMDGLSAESTEHGDGAWAGHLLQIVDELPEGYIEVQACIAQLFNRAVHYFKKYGTDKEGLVFSDDEGHYYEGAGFNVFGERAKWTYHVSCKTTEKGLSLKAIKIEDAGVIAES